VGGISAALLLLSTLFSSLLFASDPAKLAIVGATLHPVSGPTIENGILLLENGKIAALGADVTLHDDVDRLLGEGLHVYPGLIDANTTLGLTEIGSVRGSIDTAETGKVNPNIRVEIAINPDSEILPVTRANGVLAALTVPQGTLINGTSALIQLDGWTWEDVTLKAPVALHVEYPSFRIARGPLEQRTEDEQNKEREDHLRSLREAFRDARAYRQAKQAGADVASHPDDVKWAAMLPVLEGSIPVVVHASDLGAIKSAIEWAKEEKVRMILAGGADAWRVADLLAKEKIPVILGGVWDLPLREDEPYDTAFTNALKLHQAGVKFCFSEGGASNVRNLPYQAAQAAAFGLPKDEALKGVTLYPAEILGVADRLGSLEVGKDATLILTDGDPLEIRTQVLHAFVQGRKLDLNNKHLRLYERYKSRPRP
jgi:imidazolonepropionase-like amidohydrolase